MPSDLETSMLVAASGMRAQGTRIRTISENVANANSGPEKLGGEPYRRRVVTFKNVFDRAIEADLVEVSRIREDKSDFKLNHDPNHPAADKDGYVKMLVEAWVKGDRDMGITAYDVRRGMHIYTVPLNEETQN